MKCNMNFFFGGGGGGFIDEQHGGSGGGGGGEIGELIDRAALSEMQVRNR